VILVTVNFIGSYLYKITKLPDLTKTPKKLTDSPYRPAGENQDAAKNFSR